MATVVVVENDLDIGPLLEQLLVLEGHRVVLVKDPRQAMDAFHAAEPDLVYLDVRLTEKLDGFAVLRQLRAESQVPVLMCSGLDLESECLAAGADVFLLKPFDFGDLLDGVSKALGAKQGLAGAKPDTAGAKPDTAGAKPDTASAK